MSRKNIAQKVKIILQIVTAEKNMSLFYQKEVDNIQINVKIHLWLFAAQYN